MKSHRWAVALTVTNFVLLLIAFFFFLPQSTSSMATGVSPILRARALELVGEDGKVRARINVESSGEVVFRLTDQEGNIRVKLGASEEGSGLLLLNNSTEPGVQLLTKSTGTTVTLTSEEGQKVIVP